MAKTKKATSISNIQLSFRIILPQAGFLV